MLPLLGSVPFTQPVLDKTLPILAKLRDGHDSPPMWQDAVTQDTLPILKPVPTQVIDHSAQAVLGGPDMIPTLGGLPPLQDEMPPPGPPDMLPILGGLSILQDELPPRIDSHSPCASFENPHGVWLPEQPADAGSDSSPSFRASGCSTSPSEDAASARTTWHGPQLRPTAGGILAHSLWLLNRVHTLGKLAAVAGIFKKGTVRAGSLCSGIDVFGMCLHGFQLACGSLDPPLECNIEHEVVCEIDATKLAWLLRIFPDLRHAYSDVLALGQGAAWDHVTQSVCDCSPEVLCCGFSCKDLSCLNNSRRMFKRCRTVQSGSTFYGSVDCARRWKPAILIFENVKGFLCHRSVDGAQPVAIADEVLRGIGYVGEWRLVNTRDFGLPQRRHRAWLIYYRVGQGDADVAFSSLAMFKTTMIPLAECLRLGHRQVGETVVFQRPRHVKGKWQAKHSAFFRQHGFTNDTLAWAHAVLNEFTGHLHAREKSLLIGQYAFMKQFRNVDPTCEMVVVQFDQELGRCPTTVNMTPYVCPGGKYWLSYGCQEPPDAACRQGSWPCCKV